MKIETKYNTGDAVRAECRGVMTDTEIIGITATEVIEGEKKIKRTHLFYTLRCNPEASYTEDELKPASEAKQEKQSKKFDEAVNTLNAEGEKKKTEEMRKEFK